ncbi:MAG: serine/threonine-protein kinase [Planctomycetota bacterium]|nr:serine/threonine-protein kinase [Planctomycetota bacterium]
MNFLNKWFKRKPKVFRTDITKRFELIGRVGQGSMSKVWRANDTVSGKHVAVKVLDKYKTARFEARFYGLNKPTEGEIAVQLKHKYVVNTYEFGTTIDDEQFLVMEFVEGVSLSFLVDMQNEMMLKNRLNFMLQLGEGIKYFHEAGWIHRDICPRNVVVDPEGVVKLIDFGLVVPNTPTFQKPGNRTGTASYMAPELIKRQTTDQRIDIFAYAVTCFEMFTKLHPWDTGETLEAVLQAINQPPKDIRGMAPGIDEQIAATIMKGLEKHPNDRWQTIDEMMHPIREARQRLKQAAADRRKRKSRE